MQSASIDIPLFNTTARDTGTAGLTGKTTAEGTTASTQKATVGMRTFRATKLACLVPVTEELMADAPQVFSQLLARFMMEAVSERMDTAFLRGTGAGEPLGVLNSPCLVTVSKETSQVAAALVPANLTKMVARLNPPSFATSVWIVSLSALSALYTLTQVVRNVGNTENVGGNLVPWFSANSAGKMTLLSQPVVVSDRGSQLGTVGDVMLCDFQNYCVAMRQDVTFAMDRSIGFKEGELWLKVTVRVDGAPLLDAPITPRIGTDKLSTFVALETRS